MYRVDDLTTTTKEVRPGVWKIARPENSKYESFRSRLMDAWYVLTRKADAVWFDEGDTITERVERFPVPEGGGR